jgi:hypothetical protein
MWYSKLIQQSMYPYNFSVTFAMVLYSASVFDSDTVGCFLAPHDTRLDHRKTVNPSVDL